MIPDAKRSSSGPFLSRMYGHALKVSTGPHSSQVKLGALEQKRAIQVLKSVEAKEETIKDSKTIKMPVLKPVGDRPERPRASSAGRPARRGGVDLVQGVYDRLGVQRVYPVDTTEPARLVQEPSRGRSRDTDDSSGSGQTRSRSLTKQQLQWPPSTDTPSNESEPASTKPELVTRSFRNSGYGAKSESAPTTPQGGTGSRFFYYGGTKSTGSSKSDEIASHHSTQSTNKPVEFHDEKKEADEYEYMAPSARSIKERMRNFNKAEASKKSKSTEYGSSSAPRSNAPPQIDIYEGSKANGGDTMPEEKDGSVHRQEQFYIPSNSSSSLQQHDQSAESPFPAQSKVGVTARAFLTAISSPPDSANNRQKVVNSCLPFSDIMKDDQESATDSVSLSILSTESEEHGGPLRANRTILTKKPSWAEPKARNKPSSQLFHSKTPSPYTNSSSKAPMTTSAATGSGTIPASPAELMVEERVRVKMADLERRVEDQLLTFMKLMEERMVSRMDDMERQIQSLVVRQNGADRG